jgi:hypothetical protein
LGIETIDSALFVISLDEEANEKNSEKLAHQFLHNYGLNRWFDKVIAPPFILTGHSFFSPVSLVILFDWSWQW